MNRLRFVSFHSTGFLSVIVTMLLLADSFKFSRFNSTINADAAENFIVMDSPSSFYYLNHYLEVLLEIKFVFIGILIFFMLTSISIISSDVGVLTLKDRHPRQAKKISKLYKKYSGCLNFYLSIILIMTITLFIYKDTPNVGVLKNKELATHVKILQNYNQDIQQFYYPERKILELYRDLDNEPDGYSYRVVFLHLSMEEAKLYSREINEAQDTEYEMTESLSDNLKEIPFCIEAQKDKDLSQVYSIQTKYESGRFISMGKKLPCPNSMAESWSIVPDVEAARIL